MTPDSASRIDRLNGWQLGVFNAALAERMFPNYALFANITETGDVAVMRQALDKVWDHLCQRGKINPETQQSKVDAQIPNVDNFDAYGVYPALDAAVAISAAIEQIEQPNSEEALNICQLAEECVATYLEVSADTALSDEELVRYINTHELMAQQQDFTQQLLDDLLTLNTPQATKIDDIRLFAVNEGVSNIGICVDD